MEERYEAEELDADTLEYLRTATARQGHGMPGIFFDGKQARLWGPTLPVIGMLCGLGVILLTFFMTWGSLADPISVALLQTAGFFLGGWLLVAWVRSLLAKQRTDYIGYFKYVDPLYIWTGLGRGVLVRPIGMLTGASHDHNHDTNGNYSNTSVKVVLGDGRETVTVGSMSRGERLQEYLNALVDQHDDRPVDRGYAALSQVETPDDEDDSDDDARVIRDIPQPRRERRPGGLVPILLLPVFGALLFFGCWTMATRLRDDAYFEEVKNKQVGDLRAYLIDRRNIRHRAEVQARLKTQMEPIAQRVQTQGQQALGTGLAEIVRAVAGDARPVVTLCVVKQPKKETTPEAYLSEALQETMNRQVIKEMSDKLSQHLGQQTVDYGEATEPPAMIEFVPTVMLPPRGEMPPQVRLSWAVTLQATPESKKHTLTLDTAAVQLGDDPVPAVRAAYAQVSRAFNERLAGPSRP